MKRSPMKRGRGFAASPAQQAKILLNSACVVCGRDRYDTAIDPGHVTPRSLGGCNEPACVVALCREHHRAYDQEGFDLLPYLAGRFPEELAHAVLHLGLIGALERVTNERWGPVSNTTEEAAA